MRQPARVVHHAVEEIAVSDPEPSAIGSDVDGILDHVDVTEGETYELSQQLIVIAGNVDDARALAREAQELLDDVVMRLGPVPAVAQLPAVEDVADQIERVGPVRSQEIEEIVSLATWRTEVDVRYPDRPVMMALVALGHQLSSGSRNWRGS